MDEKGALIGREYPSAIREMPVKNPVAPTRGATEPLKGDTTASNIFVGLRNTKSK